MKKSFFWDSWAGALLERIVTKLTVKIGAFENYIISKRYPYDELDATWMLHGVSKKKKRKKRR